MDITTDCIAVRITRRGMNFGRYQVCDAQGTHMKVSTFATAAEAEAWILRAATCTPESWITQIRSVDATDAELAAALAATGYTKVNRGVFDAATRRYHAQPGATQYDDGSGRYNVQIGDEA